LAHHLRALGVGPEVVVGLCVERSLEMVIGLLAILKAGGAYLPLDPDYPVERLAFLLAAPHLPLLLTAPTLSDPLRRHDAGIVRLDSDWPAISGQPSTAPSSNLHPQNPAYVIYTSGSTGMPKGVTVTHAGLVNHMLWMLADYPVGADEVVLGRTAISFDPAGWEACLPLISAPALSLAPPP